MTQNTPEPTKTASPDWFVRGALTRIGDTFDRFLGRKWVPSSSLATSEIIERIKKLVDSEAKEVPGKGLVVPHDIKLKVQWNKFATDSEATVEKLTNELLVATADHINDSLYYTYAPLAISVEADYFIEGVKIAASFSEFAAGSASAEMNVTMAGVDIPKELAAADTSRESSGPFRVRAVYEIAGTAKQKELMLTPGRGVSIGRVTSNELVLDDKSVSKIHASLSVDRSGKLHIADTGSTNGTFINGERIAYGKAIGLEGDAKVTFGSVDVTFEPVAAPVGPVHEEDIGQATTIEIEGFQFTTRQADDSVETKADEEKEAEQ